MAPTTSATIGKAITFIPNGTTVEEGGYFTIYVRTDWTVITSNHNFLDGWETYDTTTFDAMVVLGLHKCFNGMGSSSSSHLLPCVFDRRSTRRGGADKAYRENVIVPDNKKNLILIGVGIDRTVITSNRNFLDGLETYDTVTFVYGNQFIAWDMTFENTAGSRRSRLW
ncbi:hypothetical protein ZIOFF_029854 [Zingiber officinale]|uniref:Pectinesterase catalytic domain-containing protein n=1 Tax=Zingiber officinale TaxID=94328 RepID=A0A8J5GS84_ZINOF|nr:hypothetical protein ZIOFF_029854 [Zingiber officinale]